MPSPNTISPAQLSRLVGQSEMPVLIDVRSDEDQALDPRMLPGSVRRDPQQVGARAHEYAGRKVITICRRGLKLSEGAAAWLRHEGMEAEILEGGFDGWGARGGLLVRRDVLPPRDAHGRTVWVTRSRPKVDRVACAWLIRRFVDASAVFLFVAPSEVEGVAERFGATPFDIDGVFWSHRGELCTFDIVVDEFGVHSPALDRLALIVRGADTGRPDLAAEVPGLLAAPLGLSRMDLGLSRMELGLSRMCLGLSRMDLGLSRMHTDDLAQLETGLALYNAFYRWSRDATGETHNWPAGHVAPKPAREKAS